jgi:hypothetical protein
MPRIVSTVCAVTLLLVLAGRARAVTEENFQLKTGADLVALCSTPKDDPLFVAAIHMCHGFGVGTYQTIQALTNHEKLDPIVCPPNPPPTRNEGLQRFLGWAQANGSRLGERPADVLGRFLIETFPCPQTPKTTAK